MEPETSWQGDLAAVVLAAGRSRRMPGKSKLLRSFKGQPVLRVVVGTALEAGLRPVAVTIASSGGPTARLLDDLPVQQVPVPEGLESRTASAAAGLASLEEEAVSGAMILLGDEPELDRADIHAIGAAWDAGVGPLLRASFRDRPGHPVLLARSLFPLAIELAAREGRGGGLWEKLTGAGVSGAEVFVDRAAPIDVDSPTDLRAARSRGGRSC